MASTLTLFILLSFLTSYAAAAGRSHTIALPQSIPAAAAEKLTTLHFYIHDFVNGQNKSVYNVAESSITSGSSSYFGQVQVADHLITAGRELDSPPIGRVQGIHVMADLREPAISVNWNFVFAEGTLTVVGRLVAFAERGELSIVGGTGEYQMARGVAYKRCLVMDPDTWNSIMEYTMYVYTSDPKGFVL